MKDDFFFAVMDLHLKQDNAELVNLILPEVFSTFGTLMLQSRGQPRDKILQVGVFQGPPDFFVSVLTERVQVHTQGTREQHRLLGRERGGEYRAS